MTADELRQASGEMRRLAEAATPGPWRNYVRGDNRWAIVEQSAGDDRWIAARSADDDDAAHIAAWHPAVALAVADWLDEVAWRSEHYPKQYRAAKHALAVARAFLGTTP
jgi:hypothetical protein